MQQPTTPPLTATQATTAGRVLADIIRSWADPHRREAIRQIINLGPGDANEDMQALQAARAALPATADLARIQRLLTTEPTDGNLIGLPPPTPFTVTGQRRAHDNT